MLKIVLMMLMIMPSVSLADESRSVNFAAFQIADENFEFEAIVEGKFSDFIAEMKGSQILALVHSAGAVDGDIMSMQTSVLRDNDGALGDFGVDCQLNFKSEKEGEDTSYLLGGVCRIIQVGGGKDLRTVLIIPHTYIPDTAQGFEGWFMLDEDEATGIAFYANVSLEH